MKYNKNKGFTLLELLVVIAIIGILSTIVMVSLQGARQRAQDASIQSYITQIRAQAEMYYSDNGYSYLNLFDTTSGDEETQRLVTEIKALTNATTNAVADGYCISAQSVADETEYHCLDSEGTIGKGLETCGGGTAADECGNN